MLDKNITRMNFERAAESYDGAAVLQREIAKRMGQRLDLLNNNLKEYWMLVAARGTSHKTCSSVTQKQMWLL